MDYVDLMVSNRETETQDASLPKQIKRSDDVDSNVKPGHIHPSIMTNDFYYDITHAKRGIALIFNHEKFDGEQDRLGTKKDTDDLKAVLEGFEFDVRVSNDLKADEIRNVLLDVSLEDHSNNDCLLVTVMSHGREDGKIAASNEDYNVQELWKNFIGVNCVGLIGKPKMFFIQACRGIMVDPGVLFKPKQAPSQQNGVDEMDVKSTEQIFVIPKLADLLVMYSTAEGHYAFRNSVHGSWFIQALCEELKASRKKDLMWILTGVNRRVAFSHQSNVPKDNKWDAAKQMPNIVSMLTKTMYFYTDSEIGIRKYSIKKYHQHNIKFIS